MRTQLATVVFVSTLLAPTQADAADPPRAQALIERQAREKANVWADDDTATFFFRGEFGQVTLLMGGEAKPLRRLPESDVWTVNVDRPELAKGVFSYAFSTGKKGDPPFVPGQPLKFDVWTGALAPPPPPVAKELKGVEKMLDLDSKNLGEKRKIKIYLPPGHDPKRSYPVIYAADGMTNGEILEPLIVAGNVQPLIVVGVLNGKYLGDRAQAYQIKQDIRACEYLPGVDNDRFAKHEKFFCDEVRSWAETKLGASKAPRDRAVQGVSNGARFAVEMGMRHPELFGQVFGFSVASSSDSESLTAGSRPPTAAGVPPRFFLAAGKWESSFHKQTSHLADELKKRKVPVVFVSRVAGHDDAMWRQELVSAVLKSFGTKPAEPAPASPDPLLGSWVDQHDPNQVIHFEASRCVFARIGETGSPRFARALYAPGKIKTHSWARKTEYAFELKDDLLSMTELPDGKTKTYRKLEKTPAEVQVKPLKLGEPKNLPEEKTRTIRDELKKRGKLDQEVRTDPTKQKDMPKVDADNTKYLVELVREVGWIDVERFGAASSNEAFLIVQHSLNVPLMLAALPPIENDVRSKRLDGQPYALLFDRLRVTLGEKQRFGSQLGSDPQGELLLMPLEDRMRVDDLRKELGMTPLSEYLKFFESQNGGKPIRFQSDE